MNRNDKISKKQIFNAADEVVARYGYSKFTMNDIAREAGISRASLYRFFKSREDIIAAQIENWTLELKKKLKVIFDKKLDNNRKLRDMMNVSVNHLTEGAVKLPDITREYFTDIQSTNTWLRPVYSVCRFFLEKTVNQGVKSSEFRKVPVKKTTDNLVMLVQLLQMHVIATHLDGNERSGNKVKNMINMVTEGIIN